MFDYGKDLQNAYDDGYKARDAEIVRCRDCKWFDEQEVCNKKFMVIMDTNFFCADGEVATVKDEDSKDSGDVKDG